MFFNLEFDQDFYMKYTQLAILINNTIINIAGFYFLDFSI